jgi:hypothetical protein
MHQIADQYTPILVEKCLLKGGDVNVTNVTSNK